MRITIRSGTINLWVEVLSALVYAIIVAAALVINAYLGIDTIPAPISDCVDEPQAYSQHWLWCGGQPLTPDSTSTLQENTPNEETKPEVEAAPALRS
jgi:hypothetical protein